MKRKRYAEEQIALRLRQHESGSAVVGIVPKMRISEQNFNRGNNLTLARWGLANDGSTVD